MGKKSARAQRVKRCFNSNVLAGRRSKPGWGIGRGECTAIIGTTIVPPTASITRSAADLKGWRRRRSVVEVARTTWTPHRTGASALAVAAASRPPAAADYGDSHRGRRRRRTRSPSAYTHTHRYAHVVAAERPSSNDRERHSCLDTPEILRRCFRHGPAIDGLQAAPGPVHVILCVHHLARR